MRYFWKKSPMLKKLLSYLVPVNIHKVPSKISKSLEVSWNNGQLVLDSANTNYSYGSLQRVLRRGLKTIGFRNILSMEHILVLGVAGGSVIRTIIEEIRYQGKITGVEIDADVVAIANKFFRLDDFPNVEIVIDDAFEFVLKTRLKYDLIIIDIFQDTNMPGFLFETFFSNRIVFLTKPSGFILFNTMVLSDADESRNISYRENLDRNAISIIDIPRLEQHNDLMLIRKRGPE